MYKFLLPKENEGAVFWTFLGSTGSPSPLAQNNVYSKEAYLRIGLL